MNTTNHTTHAIEGVRCNCGSNAAVYERSDTSSGPYARVRCQCGYVTHWWAVGWQSGSLAREWVAMQRRARMETITADWPRDARDRRIRELEERCRELEWAREEAEVMEWGRLKLGEMADRIEDLQAKNEDYIERLRACGMAAQ